MVVYFVGIHRSGCGAAWLAHLHGVQGVVGSNPAIPTNLNRKGNPLGFPFLFKGSGVLERGTRVSVPAELTWVQAKGQEGLLPHERKLVPEGRRAGGPE